MKSLLFLFIALPIVSFSQPKLEFEKKVNPLALYTNPEFIGGQKALDNYILANFKINRKDKRLKTKGEIIIKFFIAIDGRILRPSLLNKGLSEKLNKEALHLISNMPKWKPATKNGVIVETMYAYTFTIK